MGVTTRDIRPYAVTVYKPEGLIIDRVMAALQGQSKANGGVLLYSHNASAENLAHFMKSKFVLNERDLMVKDIEKTEAAIIPRNSEVDYYVQYKDLGPVLVNWACKTQPGLRATDHGVEGRTP